MTDFRPIFLRLGLQQYIDTFAAEGFETWETILDATESDLYVDPVSGEMVDADGYSDALKVKLGHRRVLQREIASAKGIRVEQLTSLNSPSHPPSPFDVQRLAQDDGVGDHGSEYETARRSKRRYRRHPKPDENAPERPPSAYVVFSNRIREDLRHQHFSFTEIAKKVGESWQMLSPEQKGQYESQAASAKEKYHQAMMSYKTTDAHREYQRYLANFKAKHGSTTEDGRPRLEHELSNASSGSIGSVGDGLNPPSANTDSHRRSDRTSSSIVSLAPEARQISTSSSVFASNPTTRGSPHSVPSLPLSYTKGSSPGSSVLLAETPFERAPSFGSSQHMAPRVIGHDPSSPLMGSSSAPAYDTNVRHPRRSPLKSVDQLPTFRHEDSSKSSITSCQSNISTPATSLSTFRGSEDENRHSIVLPPLASITPSSEDHTLQPETAPPHKPGANAYSTSPQYGAGTSPLLESQPDHAPWVDNIHFSGPFEARGNLHRPLRHVLHQPSDGGHASRMNQGSDLTRPSDALSVLADVANSGWDTESPPQR